jgi:L-alanine-DL-glutamate epimerase-like enolase superfamily enzyme
MTAIESLSQSETNRVHITDIKAMQIHYAGQTLVKVETDSGLFGIGEAGATGPVVRAHLQVLKPLLIGADPLAIEKLFHTMTSQMHTYRAHIPTVSGIDIALWDLAGKILNRPVCELLTGKYRDRITIYYTGAPQNPSDRASCQEWAQEVKELPEGYKIFKCGGIDPAWLSPSFELKQSPMSNSLTPAQLRHVRKINENIREALGFDVDIILSAHGEWDLPTAIGFSHAVEELEPLWIEDMLPTWYIESWLQYKQASRVPVLTGEKLELVREFRPFIVSGALDAIHPDLCFSGGITGCRQIAQLAELYHLPVALHNIGSIVHNLANAHFGASVRNFLMSETRMYTYPAILPQLKDMVEEQLRVVDGQLAVPTRPGLGLTLNEAALRRCLVDGEPYWD